MTHLKKILFIATLALFVLSCKNGAKKEQPQHQTEQEIAGESGFAGNYVSDDYAKRNEGYDWVSVAVSDAGDNQLKISVRSRADKKKPTCTFDATVQKVDENTYKTTIDDKNVLFRFDENNITIDTEKEEDSNILYFYCSGGATLAGTYAKINEPLDESQIDQTQFSKILHLQDVGFNVSLIKKEGKNQLTISTFGLLHDANETINLQNQIVTNTEVEDLNSDGSPELVVFAQENDGNKKGHVYAFSVNNKKSMSAVYFQPTQENKEINSGYNGQDEFALVETSLVQRFPVFENGTQTGKMKQVQYKLEDGEAARKFVVKKQTVTTNGNT